MRRLLFLAALFAAPLVLPARTAVAQQLELPIRKGELVSFDLGSRDRCDEDEYDCPRPYVRGYVYQVRKGESYTVSVLGPAGAWRVVTSSNASMDDLGPCTSILKHDEIATCHNTEPAGDDFELAIVVGSDRPVGEFHVGVYGAGGAGAFESAVHDLERGRSLVQGLNVSAGFAGRSVLTDDADERHTAEGYVLQGGFGLSDRVFVFAEYEDAIGDVGGEDQSLGEGLYGVTGYAGGLRLYLTGRRSQFRPYVQGSYGLVEREAVSGDALFDGRSLGGELGVRVFLGRMFSFDFAATGGRTTYGSVTLDGESADLGDDAFGETSVGARFGATFNVFGW